MAIHVRESGVRASYLTVLIALLSVSGLHAEQAPPVQYRWVDSQGHKHLSDEVPADAARYGYDVLNQYGRVVRHVDGAKTAEQLADERKQLEAHKAELEQQRQDQNMLLTYPTEKDLIEAQKNQVAMTEQRIASTRVNMRSQLDNLASLLDQAAQLQQSDKPVPSVLKKRIDKQRQIISEQRAWISRTRQELEQTRADNAATLKHYRAIRQP